MTWLLEHRTNFKDNGWAQLCGDSMKFGVMGGHHFSMVSLILTLDSTLSNTMLILVQMKPPHADDLGNLIREGLDWQP